MIFLTTHGEKGCGMNPSHTRKGVTQIAKLVLPEKPPLIVIGTGTRFYEIYDIMIKAKQLDGDISVKYSPFCGSADSLEADKETVTMANGKTVVLKDYIGIEKDYFDPWAFLFDLPSNTLLCAGGELMIALDLGDINEKGQLFEIDLEAGKGKKIS